MKSMLCTKLAALQATLMSLKIHIVFHGPTHFTLTESKFSFSKNIFTSLCAPTKMYLRGTRLHHLRTSGYDKNSYYTWAAQKHRLVIIWLSESDEVPNPLRYAWGLQTHWTTTAGLFKFPVDCESWGLPGAVHDLNYMKVARKLEQAITKLMKPCLKNNRNFFIEILTL